MEDIVKAQEAGQSISVPQSSRLVGVDSVPIAPLRCNVPNATDTFLGREDELAQIQNILQAGNKPIVRKSLKIHGFRGVGKSELVLKYLSEHESKYSAVIWVQCSDDSSIASSLDAIHDQLSFYGDEGSYSSQGSNLLGNQLDSNSAVMHMRQIANKLHRLSKKGWIVVLDDLRTEFRNHHYLSFPNGQTIITTLRGRGSSQSSLELTGVNDDLALKLLSLRLVTRRSGIDPEDCRELNRRLSGNVLALKQAEAYIYHGGYSLASYISLLDTNPAPLLSFKQEGAENWFARTEPEEKTIWSAMNITFMSLQSTNPQATCAIKLLAHLDVGGIRKGLLLEALSSPDLPALLEGPLKILFNELVGPNDLKRSLVGSWKLLHSYSLINYSAGLSPTDHKIILHPVANTWVRAASDLAERASYTIFTAHVLAMVNPSRPDIWMRNRAGELGSHLRQCYNDMRATEILDISPDRPVPTIPTMSFVLERFCLAFETLLDQERLLQVSKARLLILTVIPSNGESTTSFERLFILRKFGITCWKLGRLEEGLSSLHVALEDGKMLLEEDSDFVQELEVIIRQMQLRQQKTEQLAHNVRVSRRDPKRKNREDNLPDPTLSNHITIPPLSTQEGISVLELLSSTELSLDLVHDSQINWDASTYPEDILFQLLNSAYSDSQSNLSRPGVVSEREKFILQAFTLLIEGGADPSLTEQSETILHAATKSRKSRLVEILLKYSYRFDINATNNRAETPLSIAIDLNDTTSVEMLLKENAKAGISLESHNTGLLFRAVNRDRNVEIIVNLLESGLKKTIDENYKGYGTALQRAAQFASHRTIQTLLDYGADPNQQNYAGFTPLAIALISGRSHSIVELLHEKTSSNLRDFWGRKANSIKCAEPLYPKEPQASQMASQVDEGNKGKVSREISRRSSISQDLPTSTLIYYWVRSQKARPALHPETVPPYVSLVLLKAGFQPLALLATGDEQFVHQGCEMPLVRLCAHCSKTIVSPDSVFMCADCGAHSWCRECAESWSDKALSECKPVLELKADYTTPMSVSWIWSMRAHSWEAEPVYEAALNSFKTTRPHQYLLWDHAQKGEVEEVKKLISLSEMEIEDQDDFMGYTLLHLAVETRQDDLLFLLIENGANLNACDFAGWTIAHSIAISKSGHLLNSIVPKGLLLDVQNQDGQTPLHLAVLADDLEMVKMLLEAGVNHQTRDGCFKQAVQYCSSREMIELFP
ncbi:hypothetical protein ABW19_dt0204788 [Dactylella cylindrospora]|nr:hypothetical protein ABW19_dt0204788 [Dactylella cylindrospora]